MKFYPKQSVCPHCGTIYRYSDLKPLKWKKQTACYHCGKMIRVSKISLWILVLELLLIYALLNVIAINVLHTVTLLPLFIMNVAPAVAAVILVPFYLELKK